jgi:hypothetical protein
MQATSSAKVELKRTCGLEAKAVNIACLGQLIRSPRVHVPLTDRYLPAVS